MPGKAHGKTLSVKPTEPRPCKVETRLTKDEFTKLHTFSAATHISMADVLRQALRKHLAPPLKSKMLPKPWEVEW